MQSSRKTCPKLCAKTRESCPNVLSQPERPSEDGQRLTRCKRSPCHQQEHRRCAAGTTVWSRYDTHGMSLAIQHVRKWLRKQHTSTLNTMILTSYVVHDSSTHMTSNYCLLFRVINNTQHQPLQRSTFYRYKIVQQNVYTLIT